MTATLQSFNRSALGDFQKSALGDRNALAAAPILTAPMRCVLGAVRYEVDSPYGTPSFYGGIEHYGSSLNNSIQIAIGKAFSTSPYQGRRRMWIENQGSIFNVPAGIATATLRIYIRSVILGETISSLKIYYSGYPTPPSSYQDAAYSDFNPAKLVATLPELNCTVGFHNIALSAAVLNTYSGSPLSFLMATEVESAGGGSTGRNAGMMVDAGPGAPNYSGNGLFFDYT